MVLTLLLAAAVAADDSAEARVHFQAGRTHYELHQYSEAIREFAAGYALSPRPEFLINLGQAYRAAGDAPQALSMFKQYLEKAPANARPRAQVEQLVAQLEAQLAAQPPPAEAAPAAKPPADAPLKQEPPALVPMAETPPAEAVQPAQSHLSPLVWAIPLGVAVAAGAAIAVGLALSAGPKCGSGSSLGCVDLRQH